MQRTGDSSLGIQPALISFQVRETYYSCSFHLFTPTVIVQTLTRESDHVICVREEVNKQNQVVIIDLSNIHDVLRRPIGADSVERMLTDLFGTSPISPPSVYYSSVGTP
jgi:hypothetical protein